ncbi:MAG: SAVED domain-containing protein [Burkholderiales bacterium]|nr:SAVED domain-containing protein [Burkholderiales bacterium]
MQNLLWGRAAGRCAFSGCNRPLYKSPVTQESVNIAEKAHIWAFAAGGPRAGRTRNEALNDIDNLMLVCHDCHCKIDKNSEKYPAELLQQMKAAHEGRISLVTGIDPKRASRVVLFGASIGAEKSPLDKDRAHQAMFPLRFPATEDPIKLSMSWAGRDNTDTYWATESANLTSEFDAQVRSQTAQVEHWSVFGLAPIPLLVLLGTLFTDKLNADVYQLQREPFQSWSWSDTSIDTEFHVTPPQNQSGPAALVISLSDRISHDRIFKVMGQTASIWELSVAEPNNDFLKSREQLSAFRTAAKRIIREIASVHGREQPLKIFPAMPVACAIELGRIRMPKAEMPWEIFDQRQPDGFVRALVV